MYVAKNVMIYFFRACWISTLYMKKNLNEPLILFEELCELKKLITYAITNEEKLTGNKIH